jgi:hypothetical protein
MLDGFRKLVVAVLEVKEGEGVSWVRVTMRWGMVTAAVLELEGGGGSDLALSLIFSELE